MTAAGAFLTQLWGGRPPGLIATWRKADKRTTCYPLPTIAGKALDGQTDVYVAVAAAGRGIQPTKRATGKDVSAIPGLWLDIDVNGGPDGKRGAAPDLAAAERLARSIVEPTLIVCSGYGLHAWWLFEGGPLRWRTTVGRDEGQELARRWYALHRERSEADGWTIDHTHDLARLLRPPGTFNGKGAEPVPVTLHADGGPRYTVDRLTELAAAAPATAAPSTGGLFDQLADATAAKLDMAALERLLTDELFGRTWRHERTEHPAWSDSEYDLALCTIARRHGWEADQLAALVVHHRAERGSPKGRRDDYVRRTVARALVDQPRPVPAAAPAGPEPAEPPAASTTFTAEQWAQHIADMLERPGTDAIPTPWPKLTDGMDGGFRPGEVCLVAAYTSHGKSVVVDQIADHAAKHGARVHLYMTEMTAYSRGLRYLARGTGVPFWRLKRKEFEQVDLTEIYDALSRVAYGCSIVSDWSVDQVVAHVRANRWDLCVVDLIHGFHYQDERDLSRTSSAIVRAAKGSAVGDFAGTTIICAAHLNDGQMRDSRSPKRPRPGLHSIKGSSSLKQDADLVWFVWQEDDDNGLPTGVGSLWIAKNRDGEQPSINVELDYKRMAFKEIFNYIPGTDS